MTKRAATRNAREGEMTARNGRGGPPSTEEDGRLRRQLRDAVAEGQGAEGGGDERGQEYPEPVDWPMDDKAKESEDTGDTGQGDGGACRRGQGLGGGAVGPVPDTHALEGSAFLTAMMMVWFVLFTIAMSGQLPWRAYLIAGGAGYAGFFAFGFMAQRWWPATMRDRERRPPAVGFEWRLAILAIMLGFMVQGFFGSGADLRVEWEPPLLWVPAILMPAIAMGGAIEGALLGEIASGLPRRTPWHALCFIISTRRRSAAERNREEQQ